jgi:hypothetical protein
MKLQKSILHLIFLFLLSLYVVRAGSSLSLRGAYQNQQDEAVAATTSNADTVTPEDSIQKVKQDESYLSWFRRMLKGDFLLFLQNLKTTATILLGKHVVQMI